MTSTLTADIANAVAAGQHAHHRGWKGNTWVVDTDVERAVEQMYLTGTRVGFLCDDSRCVYAGVNPMRPTA